MIAAERLDKTMVIFLELSLALVVMLAGAVVYGLFLRYLDKRGTNIKELARHFFNNTWIGAAIALVGFLFACGLAVQFIAEHVTFH